MRLIVLAPLLATLTLSEDHASEVRKWRAEREERLKAPDGWLTLVGLAWLKEGPNTVGSAHDSRVQLPAGLPERAGILYVSGKTVTYQAQGKPRVTLKSDANGNKPDIVTVGRVRFYVIDRGGKIGVRIKDDESEARRHFKGLRWYPIKPDWRIRTRFVPAPRTVYLDAQAGGKQRNTSPGYAEFERSGQKIKLTPVDEDGQLFFVFRDTTAGKTTYPAARFLYAQPTKDGTVILDFNKAYNPPCVFTPYSTCPLPPRENRLKIPIEAGEMMYEGADAHR